MNQVFFLPTAARMRRFLHQNGIRIKPWHSLPQSLDSLYRQLADEKRTDEFWTQFRQQSAALVGELRDSRTCSSLIVDMAKQTSTLVETIRETLTHARRTSGDYSRLNELLPPSSMGLLIAVSLAAVACGGIATDGEQVARGGTPGSSSGGAPGVATGGTVSTTAGAMPAMGGATSAATGGTMSATGGATSAATGGTGGFASCSESPSIQSIFDACGVASDFTRGYLEQLAKCDPSWESGLAAYFSCWDCDGIKSYLADLCYPCGDGKNFNIDMTFCPQLIYIVVAPSTALRVRRERYASVFAPCTQPRG